MTLPERTSPGVVAVTGASGYIGTLVCERYRRAGWTVVPLQRTVAPEDTDARRFVLGEPVDPAVVTGVDVLVHCAWDLTATHPADVERVNVKGTAALAAAAAAAGVGRLVLISSMSAYWGTDQLYGASKLACERIVADYGGVSVRLGLVYGDGWGGMVGSLRKLVALPVTPLLGAHAYQYTVHEDDCADGILALGESDAVAPGTVIGLAHPRRVPFREVLRGIGRHAGVAPRLVRVPWLPVYAGMRLAERLHIALPLRSDSLLGLVRPAGFVPSVERWNDLGVHLRPFAL